MSEKINPKKRGSELLRELHGDHHGFDMRSLDLIDAVLEDESVQLLGWHRYGQPAVDQAVGSFLVEGRAVASVVGKLRQGLPWGVHVFPYGIPPVYLTVVQVTQNVAPTAVTPTNVIPTAGI
jgi:hypothetical protein